MNFLEILKIKRIQEGLDVFCEKSKANDIKSYYIINDRSFLSTALTHYTIENEKNKTAHRLYKINYISSLTPNLSFYENESWDIITYQDFLGLIRLEEERKKQEKEAENLKAKQESSDKLFLDLSEEDKKDFLLAKEKYPDLLITTHGRSRRIIFHSKLANADVDKVSFNYSCGCCSDAATYAFPRLEIENRFFVYSRPFLIMIGEGTSWFVENGFQTIVNNGTNERYDWRNEIKNNNINPIISELIEEKVKNLIEENKAYNERYIDK